jgi:hypothetical protein
MSGIDNFVGYSQSESSVVNDYKFQEYETPNTIKIQYPTNWSRIELPYLSGVLFFPPTDPVGVIVQNSPAVDYTPGNGLLNEITSMQVSIPNLKIINYNSYDNNNTPEQEIMFTYGDNITVNNVYQFKKVDNYTVHEFTFFADKRFFDKYSQLAFRMLNSFLSPSNHSSLLDNGLHLTTSNDKAMSTGIGNKTENSTTNEKSIDVGLQKSPTSPNFIQYENHRNGMNFTYPDFFNLTENENGIYLVTENKSIGFFIDFKPSNGQSLTNFTNSQSTYLENRFENYSVVNASIETIFDMPTQMVHFSYLNNSEPSDALQLITVKGDRGIIFTYFSPHGSFNIFLPFIIDIVESVKIGTHTDS